MDNGRFGTLTVAIEPAGAGALLSPGQAGVSPLRATPVWGNSGPLAFVVVLYFCVLTLPFGVLYFAMNLQAGQSNLYLNLKVRILKTVSAWPGILEGGASGRRWRRA